jgi:hypothetical protein
MNIMDTKTLVKALKVAVREVIKEELTEILKEGLQSTINEMKQPKRTTNMPGHRTPPPAPKRKTSVQFQENKWASILNQTDPIIETEPIGVNSFAEIMNESYDTLSFTSQDAQGFGMNRKNISNPSDIPSKMEDPETGKVYDVAPEVQQALTRDYSALMAAMNKKKGN